ncbi:hypothetical protein BKA82DRAFT_20060 [Pisolithus tinctorius]|uniref:Uncharacterized protein n=1 Tax=Pisolithus tinctorius Marx 270 TaxID=870435 RepID=A0A0C3PEI1_PISTI|nr:hypothetical protein BKA82DRAFT_20060 [Pisolithus tinctorius]KIO12230.1 hypothetical protein M404DRAFT_20060 [Pisolithus tinctorius Marx 270]
MELDLEMSYKQYLLSGCLQLLNLMGYSDSSIECSNKATRAPDTNTTIRVLDTVALALTTRKPGEVFAVALDTRGGLTLVLGKNDDVTADDDRAARDFFKLISDSEATQTCDVLSFLFSRCAANIAERIMKLNQAVNEFSCCLNDFLRTHYFFLPSLEDEFPLSLDYRKSKYGGEQISSVQMLRDLLEGIPDINEGFNLWDLSETPGLLAVYSELVLACQILRRSRILCQLCKSTDPWPRTQAEKLRRCLAMACHYQDGLSELIKHVKGLFPDGVKYRWAGDIEGTGETTVNLGGDYSDTVRQTLGDSLLDDALATLCFKFPWMARKWHKRCSVTTRLHAEIRVLLDLSNPVHGLDHSEQQPIGCSKWSCLCCALWILAYNEEYGTNWLTSGSHGKVYAAWALPGRGKVDEHVLTEMQVRLAHALQHFPTNQRLPDAERSESEDAEEKLSDGAAKVR